ncbi:MAG: putative inorganic carbon transporter subunit DabA, partial [Pseudomonadota bacterium]
YHGSTTAPEQFGAGDKLLHNVTGGIGVIEGSGGHLRVGLPWQSVHDGERLQHEATRLAVVIAAPTDAIDGILDRHEDVRALFANGWLSLHAMDDAGRLAHRYGAAGWSEV